ncbi:DEAD/DEAH box helicase [Aestuariimicrobium sp. T2.26MG-19.2B]|uniref:DEAD/DEAH box helicase n=1 Tax=Aestuariimicrobium sp. T2.26MG-19.2B TaxID=3040679 RepID=UPI0024775B8F|nr:DEAD/DEAH box helicase [Aestuariimicrobium sp. T2.26MG-19.2B]CAI9408450.1 ATP-dependent RNA helicase RhlE [Aestuariimicrobium sp. T2.26MG-19.2B]
MVEKRASPQQDGSALASFSEPTQRWFTDSFTAPTPAQAGAWRAISSGEHSLLIAPTGSGKTLAAFLHSIDRLTHRASRPEEGHGDQDQVRVLYISPLKALAVDVERNLTAPLRGIQLAAARLGRALPPVTVAVRTGDTAPAERRRQLVRPPDILITTPESLFLMLSGQHRDTLTDLDLVIIDEIHALAGTKRGAHLALSLERLDALHQRGGAQRVGLSATVRPAERVAAFLGGDRPVTIVQPPADKRWELHVEVPVADMTQLALPPDPETGMAEPNQSIWPFIESRVLDLIEPRRSTLCFVNSRRVAERLTAHLNEQWATRLGEEPMAPSVPAHVMAQSGAGGGREEHSGKALARAHHGSVSKERRAQIEADLKSGALACVVATSSLELGIDMGAVDQVIQISSPPSVASGLQRVGRAGHQVGAVSRGVILPTHRGDLIESGVIAERMVTGQIEDVRRITNPLDVLAQQLVSMCIDTSVTAAEARAIVLRSDPYRELPESAFNATLDMLTGRYPSDDWAELRPRLVWDRATDRLTARPGAKRLVTTSGGTIPDRGLFGVFLVGDGAGRRVGELDEEMVYESRVGDLFTLGTSTWRIEEITANQVMVSPAPGQPGRLPFWHGDANSRPLALGRALGEFTDRLQSQPDNRAEELRGRGLDAWAVDNALAHLDEQQRATGVVPGARTVVVERCRDELGDWRVLVHANWGAAVLAPWAMVIESRARDHYGVEARATATNDGIIIRIPDVERQPPGAELLDISPDDVEQVLTTEVFGSALFAARFRECAARALLLPRRDPRRRSPLWQQRMRSAQLLQVASQYPDFPIVLETLRECMEDVFDLPGLTEQLMALASRRIRLLEVETDQPSPYARNLLFSYVGEFIYDSDQPLAERTLAAAGIDQNLLAELLGRSGEIADLLDPEAARQVEAEVQRTAEHHRAETLESWWDVIRTLGPLTVQEANERAEGDAELWLRELTSARRVAAVSLGRTTFLVTPDDLPLLRDGLGVPVPPGHSAGAPLPPEEALARLVLRWVRTHTGASAEVVDARYRLPSGTSEGILERARSSPGSELEVLSHQWWHRSMVQRVRRRSLALLRSGVEPVDQSRFAAFAPRWHELDEPGSGPEALMAAVEALAGCPIPASMLETLVLPARVSDYRPEMLDDLLARGDVSWSGHGAIGTRDGWVQLWPADLALPEPAEGTLSPLAEKMVQRALSGGAWTVAELSGTDEVASTESAEATDALWELVWTGRLTSSTFMAVREHTTRGALRTPKRATPRRRTIARPLRAPRSGGTPGRWSASTPAAGTPTERDLMAASMLLSRHGVVTRGAVQSEALFGSFGAAYRVLAALEEQGGVRRGYFVEGLGASQFALPGAVDLVREDHPEGAVRLLAACDPANPFGAALPWPESPSHRPTRRAGALVVLGSGQPLIHLERGVRTMLAFTDDPERIVGALSVVADAVRRRVMSPMTIETINGEPALGAQLANGTSWRSLLEGSRFTMTPQGFRPRTTP